MEGLEVLAMRFHSAVSQKESTSEAVEQIIADVRGAAGGRGIQADVVFVFFTAHHRDEAESLVEDLWLELDPQTLVGCSGEGIIGGDREVEREPGLAVLVGHMPGVRVHPFHIDGESDWRHALSNPEELSEKLGLGPETRAVIGFGDPFTSPIAQLLDAVNDTAPGVPLVGGMASAGRSVGENVVLRNDRAYHSGMVGVSFCGPVSVQTVVSQGCRPIGRPMVITKSHDNVIEQLGGKPALDVLRQTVVELDEDDKRHLSNGLFVGRAISEYRDSWGRGDFLVRNVIGVDEKTGAVGIADYVRSGQTVQFHARDAQTAGEDLTLMLETQKAGPPPAGGLLFSCNGRGTRLFDRPSHDLSAANSQMPATPFAGFFAAGELGPVGGKNFMHGHTASFALFREKACDGN